jgi:hypothetical protein
VLLLSYVLLLSLAAFGCSSSSEPSEPAAGADEVAFNPKLQDELLGMLKRDQRERTGGAIGEGDEARTERLKEIIDQYGWPTIDLVGSKGEDAAWAIAQHSDQDLEFQREALELLRDAVDAGNASPGNLAYLEDRVAVASGEPQVYGTQMGCGRNGPKPATPIADRASVDERRADAGLDPLTDYVSEMAEICAQTGN